MPEYAMILVFLALVSFFLHRRYKLKLFISPRHAVSMIVLFFLIGIVWDQYAIARGHWSYNPRFLLGLWIGYMPLEDIGFALVGIYLGLVIYKLTERYVGKRP